MRSIERADGTFKIRAPAGRNFIYLRGQPEGWLPQQQNVDVVEGETTEVVWRVWRMP